MSRFKNKIAEMIRNPKIKRELDVESSVIS